MGISAAVDAVAGAGAMDAGAAAVGAAAGGLSLGGVASAVGAAGSIASGISALTGGGGGGSPGVGQSAQQGAAQADPFAPYHQMYAQQLNALMANPTASLQNIPGYKAGLQAVETSMAAQGYNGSGNMATALLNYGGNIFQQQEQMLAQLAGVTNANPGAAGQITAQGGVNQAQLTGQGLNSLTYGLGKAANMFGGGGGTTDNSLSLGPSQISSFTDTGGAFQAQPMFGGTDQSFAGVDLGSFF